MFNRDVWNEIFIALKRNKLRTVLTGFAISWGIFMLILLLAAGNGLKNGVSSNFEGRLNNTYTIYSGFTSKPYKGHKEGRSIDLNDQDLNLFGNGFPHVDKISPSLQKWGIAASYKKETSSISLNGVYPILKDINSIKMINGRFINDQDIAEERKVIVIDESLKTQLFPSEEATGKYMQVKGIPFLVVGIYKGDSWGGNSMSFVPFSWAKKIFNEVEFSRFSFTTKGLETDEQNEAYREMLKQALCRIHEVDPDDERAFYIKSSAQNAKETNMIFNAIQMFIWFIGIAMLISGVVGVSNIMLITVKERTNEIGIRKALGAKPRTILQSIVLESLLITTIFGYMGMFTGILFTELLNSVLAKAMQPNSNGMVIFQNPTVDMGIVIAATVVLIVSGILAGFIPARKAVKIKPIEAIQYR